MTPEAKALAERHVLLARRIAWDYLRMRQGVDPEDVESDAMFGLVDAASRFDTANGASFHTYATIRIRGAIADGRRNSDGASRLYRGEVRELERAHYRYAAKHGRYPTRLELAEFVGTTMQRMDDVTVYYRRARRANMVDLDAPIEGTNNLIVRDMVADPDADVEAEMLTRETKAIIADYLPRLRPNEHMVIALYYWDELTLGEIGEILGVTESRASQILSKAKARLDGWLRSDSALAA